MQLLEDNHTETQSQVSFGHISTFLDAKLIQKIILTEGLVDPRKIFTAQASNNFYIYSLLCRCMYY